MSKTINKEDLITITVGDLFTACYDAAIVESNTVTAGNAHAEAHNLAGNALALALNSQKALCENCKSVTGKIYDYKQTAIDEQKELEANTLALVDFMKTNYYKQLPCNHKTVLAIRLSYAKDLFLALDKVIKVF